MDLIAAERYYKIVHVVFYRAYCKWWLLFAGLTFSWATVVVIDIVFVWLSDVVDGVWYPYYNWQSRDSTWPTPTKRWPHVSRRTLIGVRWMLLPQWVSYHLAFVLCWLPNQLFYILSFIGTAFGVLGAYYTTVFLIILIASAWIHWFTSTYATKHKEVKSRIRKWFFKTRLECSQKSRQLPLPSDRQFQELNIQSISLTVLGLWRSALETFKAYPYLKCFPIFHRDISPWYFPLYVDQLYSAQAVNTVTNTTTI